MIKNSPFSFNEINNSAKINLCNPIYFPSSDGIKLAYYCFRPNKPAASLIFIHGGGAYSGGGYQYLAKGLSEKRNLSVYLLDLRGHGNSERSRGDSPSVIQPWIDLKLFISKIKEENKEIPLYLGGHSSGGGFILNYLTWNKDGNIDRYFFISPEFGYKSKTARKNKVSFAKVNIFKFFMYGILKGKKYGNDPAVYFNYPEDILKLQPLFLKFITCNMSLSLTPNNPQEQFKNIDKPFHLFVGENDELFIPENVVKYAEFPKEEIRLKSTSEIVKEVNHLSILNIADDLIGNILLSIDDKI